MGTCGRCGSSVKYIYNQKTKEKIMVDATAFFFLPPNGFFDKETFITPTGNEVEGYRSHSDGKTGYKRHICKG